MHGMLTQVEGWAAEFDQLCERISPRFARPEVRRRVAGFLRGLLGDVERKNGWQLAEQAGETTPDGMQRLSPLPAGTPMGSAMTCAATWSSIWATLAGCWWSTRPGS
jgi:hypothetical protein